MTHPYSLAFAAAATLLLLLLFTAGQRIVSPGNSFFAGPLAGTPGGKPGEKSGPNGRNDARALLYAGNVAAVFMIAASVAGECVTGDSLADDALWVAVSGIAALGVFAISARLGVAALLGRTLPAELARGNVAAGVAAGAHSLATGIVVAHCVTGTDARSLGVSLVFFALAQVSLHVLVSLFRVLTSYDDDDEVRDANVAAALSYAGVTIAVGILVGGAVDGPFAGWSQSLRGFGIALGYAVALYPVRQIVVEGLLLGAMPRLRRGGLDHAIARERRIGIGALEATTYIATALLIQRVG